MLLKGKKAESPEFLDFRLFFLVTADQIGPWLCAYGSRSTLILCGLAPILERRHADFFTESFNKIAGRVESAQI